MRVLIASVLAVLFSVSAFAETDYLTKQALFDIREGRATPNAIRKLLVTESIEGLPAGSIVTAALADDAVTAAKLADDSVGSAAIGAVSQTYTGTSEIVTTLFTPAFVGQLLVGTVSNTFHGSKGVTTNDWVPLN